MIESVNSDLSIKINNQEVYGLLSFKSEENADARYYREFLNSSPWAVKRGEGVYTLTLEFYTDKPFIPEYDFTLTAEGDNSTETYRGCYIKSSSLSYKDGKQTSLLIIKSHKKE